MPNVFIIGPFVETFAPLKQGPGGEGGIPRRDEGREGRRTNTFPEAWSVAAAGAPGWV